MKILANILWGIYAGISVAALILVGICSIDSIKTNKQHRNWLEKNPNVDLPEPATS